MLTSVLLVWHGVIKCAPTTLEALNVAVGPGMYWIMMDAVAWVCVGLSANEIFI